MGSNTFGSLFRVTTWGESHGKAIGVVIDGCPANLPIEEEEINQALFYRSPGRNPYISSRKEPDRVEIMSGVFEGKTTGTPISLIIFNRDADSSKYEPIKHLNRPGHANFTYLEKYGVFDYRGGGRASARETACRVAAGAVAKKLLSFFAIDLVAYVEAVGSIRIGEVSHLSIDLLHQKLQDSPIFCPDEKAAEQMLAAIMTSKKEKDSLGAVIACRSSYLPIGLGDPIYEKLEANLAKAMLSLPASKGIEIGTGFRAAKMRGSEHNDLFVYREGRGVETKTNHAGGVLGGISSGMPLFFRVPFKPTSSILQPQRTVDREGKSADFLLPPGSRHDPCVGIRAAPIVEAMTALVLVDALLMNRTAQVKYPSSLFT